MASLRKSRLKLLRSTQLEPDEKKLVEDVEQYGCHIIQVKPQEPIPGWSYTIGIYETQKRPELIVIGLKDDVAHYLLNEVADRLREGLRLKSGQRQKDLLENVECEFREVERRWVRQTMGYAVWFYGDDSFPVMQCIYPDLENHLPWEHGFDETWRQRQPLLFAGPPASRVESDFWAANDPWKFPDPPHTLVYTTKRIMKGEEPILYVSHDAEDGAWQFHGPSESKVKEAALICFHHIIDKDPTIKELADLPLGWHARRDGTANPWIREQSPPDPEED